MDLRTQIKLAARGRSLRTSVEKPDIFALQIPLPICTMEIGLHWWNLWWSPTSQAYFENRQMLLICVSQPLHSSNKPIRSTSHLFWLIQFGPNGFSSVITELTLYVLMFNLYPPIIRPLLKTDPQSRAAVLSMSLVFVFSYQFSDNNVFPIRILGSH